MRLFLRKFSPLGRTSIRSGNRSRTLLFEQLSDRVPFAVDLNMAIQNDPIPIQIEAPLVLVPHGAVIDGQIPVSIESTQLSLVSTDASPSSVVFATAGTPKPAVQTLSTTHLSASAVQPFSELQLAVVEPLSDEQLGVQNMESFDGSFVESSMNLEDGYGGYGGGLGTPPEIVALSAYLVEGNFRFVGQVTDDESLSGCQVRFGGVLDGHFSTIDSEGVFSFEISFPQGTNGWVTAIARDMDGLDSQEFSFMLR